MAVPTYDEFMSPLLRVLADHHEGMKASVAREAAATLVGLTADDRAVKISSGQLMYDNRLGWAHDRLKKNGLSSCPQRGLWQITPSGLEFLKQHATGFDVDTMRKLLAVGTMLDGMNIQPNELVAPPTLSPEEQIDRAVRELENTIASELLDQVKKASPSFFERLVLQLLKAMGYGSRITHVGQPGDGGIDGLVDQDRLGLDKVYTQAKRWSTGPVGRPDVQAFQGAMAGLQARKGVFMTTSSFTKDARDYAARVGIVLVDGAQLGRLMIEYGVGVTRINEIRIVRVDNDFFDET